MPIEVINFDDVRIGAHNPQAGPEQRVNAAPARVFAPRPRSLRVHAAVGLVLGAIAAGGIISILDRPSENKEDLATITPIARVASPNSSPFPLLTPTRMIAAVTPTTIDNRPSPVPAKATTVEASSPSVAPIQAPSGRINLPSEVPTRGPRIQLPDQVPTRGPRISESPTPAPRINLPSEVPTRGPRS